MLLQVHFNREFDNISLLFKFMTLINGVKLHSAVCSLQQKVFPSDTFTLVTGHHTLPAHTFMRSRGS